MTVEYEEKLLKNMGMFAIIIFLAATFFVKNEVIKLVITMPYLALLIVFNYRKFKRDTSGEGKDLLRYKRSLFFVVLTLVITTFFLVLPYFK